MVSKVIELVNSALDRIGQKNVTPEEFDSGTERHHVILREAFKEIWEEITDLNHDDFKRTFEITLNSVQKEYDLGFHPSQLATLRLYLDGKDIKKPLFYVPENEIREIYLDLDDIPTGEPSDWFICTSSQNGVQKLRFNPNPDSEYLITGMMQEHPKNLTANSFTSCNNSGDKCIKAYIEWMFQLENGFSDATFFERRFEIAFSEYCAINSKKNAYYRFMRPFQIF